MFALVVRVLPGSLRVQRPPMESISTMLSTRHSSSRSMLLERVGSRGVDARVEELEKAGHTILPLKPYPNRPLPPHIVNAAIHAVQEPHSAPSRGLDNLRQAIAGRLEQELRLTLDPEREILVTNGGMHALFVAFAALVDTDEEVIVPAPCYFLQGIADLLGFNFVYVPMLESAEFRFDPERLAAAITPHTRAIFLNTPVNPTGYVFTKSDLEFLIDLAHTHGLMIVSDESYDRMVYDGRRHISPLELPGSRECTVLVRSLTKSYCMPAWRVGYITAPSELVPEMTKVLEWQCLYGSGISQAAAAAALEGPQDWLAGIAEEFQANRDRILSHLASTPLSCVTPQGAPFVFLNTSKLDMTGDVFATALLERFGIAATPGSTLKSLYHVRVPIGGSAELLDLAGQRLALAARR